ncbi:uncharacterized protein LOC133553184 isoform X4 [Nerophis ophidion]|uniref:uncharacterized protein LOC133553184 isoform X4 n=1 Tax=Nerophis ophidion TaxID=159077 RepID=UPI002ADF6A4D|nr:uncharacterized protein LOC133553184 isoform X4 [Nerophis ophidion]
MDDYCDAEMATTWERESERESEASSKSPTGIKTKDEVFSTRRRGWVEPGCLDGTIAAGYVRDSWNSWRIMCLSALSIEDVEDIYLFGAVITGHLLVGLGIALVDRQIRKTMAATQGAQRLFNAMEGLGRAVGTQTCAISIAKWISSWKSLQRRNN